MMAAKYRAFACVRCTSLPPSLRVLYPVGRRHAAAAGQRVRSLAGRLPLTLANFSRFIVKEARL